MSTFRSDSGSDKQVNDGDGRSHLTYKLTILRHTREPQRQWLQTPTTTRNLATALQHGV